MGGLDQIGVVLGIAVAVVALIGSLWKFGRSLWRIEEQVSNHIPTRFDRVETKIDINTDLIAKNREELAGHEEREEIYWKLVERFLKGDDD